MSEIKGLHLHFDAPTGAAGDMTLGALFDLGVPEEPIREVLAGLSLTGYELTVKKCLRGGIAGTDVKVNVHGHIHEHAHAHAHPHAHAHEHEHVDLSHDHHSHALAHPEMPHRHYRDLRALVSSGTTGAVRDLALSIFDKVAVAEAKLHGVSVDDVLFHEVGAIDSIVDVVASAAAIDWLAPSSVSATPVAVGGGSVGSAHGRLPVPAPATLEICRAAGVPFIHGGVDRELLTPTGAAILATVVAAWGPCPPLTAVAVGYGAGDMELHDRPNLLRALVGRRLHAAPGAELVELHANLDDMSPELCEHVADRLFEAGALDVWWSPVTMKKSRPAFILGVLAPAERRDAVCDVVLSETTSLGVRLVPVARVALDRRVETVATPHGAVSVKLGLREGRVVNVAPEYESCRAVARAAGVPLKEIYAAAVAAYRQR